MEERTLILIKPDGVRRGLTGEIITRFERRGFKIIGLKKMKMTREIAEKHYQEHIGRDYYPALMDFITSGPIIAMVLEAPDVIRLSRLMMGKTNPWEALPGTIRGDYGLITRENIVHGSDSFESTQREIPIFFSEDELLTDN